MPCILALETATDACSVAISTNNKTCDIFVVQPQAHTKLILNLVDDVCKQAGVTIQDVDAIAYGQGPGSFTGVRIAASVVQGLAIGLQKPIIPVSTLQALAQQATIKNTTLPVLALLDARMQEVYFGVYDIKAGLAKCVIADSLINPENLVLDAENYLAIGTGALVYEKILLQKNPNIQFAATIQYPRAKEVLELALEKYLHGETKLAHDAIPTYIRNNVAHKSKKNPD